MRIFLFLCLGSFMPLLAQHSPTVDYYAENNIEQWESFLPYNFATDIVEAGDIIYASTEAGILRIYTPDKSFKRYSKVNYLSDMGVSALAYSSAYSTLIVGYANGNLDLIKDNGGTINRPAIKQNTNISANKKIKHIHCDSNLIYLSTEFGLISFDLSTEEFVQTTFINNLDVNASSTLGNKVFISTTLGIYWIDRQNNVQDFSNWTKVGLNDGLYVDVFESNTMVRMQNMIYADVNDTVMRYNGNRWEHIPTTYNGTTTAYCHTGRPKLKMQVNAFNSGVTIATGQNLVEAINSEGNLSVYYFDPAFVGNNYSALTSTASEVWVASSKGIFKNNADGSASAIFPEGPYRPTVSKMVVDKDGTLWCAGSPRTFNSTEFNANGFYRYKNYSWAAFNRDMYAELSDAWGAYNIIIDPQTGNTWGGSYLGGLFEFDSETEEIRRYTGANVDNGLDFAVGDPLRTRVTAFAFDKDNNLWMTNASSAKPIVVKKVDGTWNRFFSTSGSTDFRDLAIDRYGYKWILQKSNVLVFDSGEDIDNVSDDRYLVLTTNNSELGDNKTYSIATDRDGAVWIGSGDGVTIFNCDVFEDNCSGVRPVINPDNFNGRLLEAERVSALVCDGANRMWAGTDNGLFLVDGDSYEQIHFFNEENSPLFSNQVSALAIDPLSGQVYIAGNSGLQAYRAKATQASSFMDKNSIRVFPNPVRPEYDGYIAINGLAEDANVKITDVSGQLVFEQTAFGGQAVWNGINYLGEAAAAGVYLVFVVNDDATQKLVAKFALIR